jgi:hypothetical protein
MDFTGVALWVVLLLVILWLVVLFTSIKGLISRTDISLGMKIIWAIVISIAPVLGLIFYVIVGRKARKGMKV